jgi:hypothetical protein
MGRGAQDKLCIGALVHWCMNKMDSYMEVGVSHVSLAAPARTPHAVGVGHMASWMAGPCMHCRPKAKKETQLLQACRCAGQHKSQAAG